MKCLCDVKCRVLKDVDMFGKDPELYYKGRPKKTSWIGRILSFIFVFVFQTAVWVFTQRQVEPRTSHKY